MAHRPPTCRLRLDLNTIPLEDIEPCHVVPATRAGDRNRLVVHFRMLAEAQLTGQPTVPPAG